MKLVLGILGEKFSGKDVATDYLSSKFDTFSIRHSYVLDEILNTLGLPVSRRNEIDLGMALRGPFGTSVVGKAVEKRVKESTKDLRIIQSIRFQEEFDIAKGLGAAIIYLTAKPEIRYKRAMSRNEKADDQVHSYEEFLAMETKEPTEVGIPGLGAKADYRIDNNGTLEELHGKLDELMAKLQTAK